MAPVVTIEQHPNIDSVIQDNMGLIIKVAQSFNPRDNDQLDEYIQLGRIGTWKAYKKYKGNKAALSTWIWLHVRWEIIRGIKNTDIPYSPLDKTISCKNASSLWEYLPSSLTNEERQILDMKLEGYHFIKIDERFGKSRGWSNGIFKKVLQKIRMANA